MFRIWFSQIMMLYREAFAMQQSCFMDFFLLLLLSFFFLFFFFVCAFVGWCCCFAMGHSRFILVQNEVFYFDYVVNYCDAMFTVWFVDYRI